ncbi:aminotransferase class I/II-fold pyridoxal phosphate-dependent enzyme [Metabacillus dongyingensis]|uniref:aminotransferase class I/II-fold pyridoxal phosphate-dependent enzyme n=1 Tax=Metabacillus dongyingensis TaxID=2874282 RepID=UPI003B8ADCDB
MDTPLYSALKRHAMKRPVSFHVPGHKYGKIFSQEARDDFEKILKLDATEITGLDDLHDPSGPIAEAQELAAALYKADKTFFLVNGSTSGNIAMIMACCERDKPVLVQRNSHKSIINGIRLAGACPVFLAPKFDEELMVPSYVPQETIAEAINEYPDASALILTSPNYYGLACDLHGAIKLAHEKNIPVLVDEAHGAHFILGDPFPKSALEAGADVVVHSAHKTLPAMTMGSFLHVNGKLANANRIGHYLSILQSSSPSYPIMASLDLARAYLQGLTSAEAVDSISDAINSFENTIMEIDELCIVRSNDRKASTDPLKLTIKSTVGMTGFELQSHLEASGIYTELADLQNVLLVLPLASKMAPEFGYTTIKGTFALKNELNPLMFQNGTSPISMPLSNHQLNGYSREVVSFKDAAGLLSGDAVIPYPPGIPLLMEGERITKEHIIQIQVLIQGGARFQGSRALTEEKLAVYIKKR